MFVFTILRRILDGLYWISGVLAALCLIAILLLIVVQMLARWTGEVASGIPEYAGYAMAAASFLAFANALNRGNHIRVSILLNAVGSGMKRLLDIWCFGIGALIAWYFVKYAYYHVYWSWKFNEISQGQDRTAVWMPQSLMLIGATILAVALTDHLLRLIFLGYHNMGTQTLDSETSDLVTDDHLQ